MSDYENLHETYVHGSDTLRTYSIPELPGVHVEWNGSATFNLYHDGTNMDVRTHYGDDSGGSCSPEQAREVAHEWLAELA